MKLTKCSAGPHLQAPEPTWWATNPSIMPTVGPMGFQDWCAPEGPLPGPWSGVGAQQRGMNTVAIHAWHRPSPSRAPDCRHLG